MPKAFEACTEPHSSLAAAFDTSSEPFERALPALSKGSHVVAVRAQDAHNNLGSAEVWIDVK